MLPPYSTDFFVVCGGEGDFIPLKNRKASYILDAIVEFCQDLVDGNRKQKNFKKNRELQEIMRKKF